MIISRLYKAFISITFLLIPTSLFADELIKDAADGKPHAQYLLGRELLGNNNNSGLDYLLIASIQGHLKSILLLDSKEYNLTMTRWDTVWKLATVKEHISNIRHC